MCLIVCRINTSYIIKTSCDECECFCQQSDECVVVMTFKQFHVIFLYEELPWLKRLVADFLVRKPAFDPRQVLMVFVLEP
jgi:hypothetical protein